MDINSKNMTDLKPKYYFGEMVYFWNPNSQYIRSEIVRTITQDVEGKFAYVFGVNLIQEDKISNNLDEIAARLEKEIIESYESQKKYAIERHHEAIEKFKGNEN